MLKNKEFAIKYAQIGWHILPVHSMIDGICSCGFAECKTPAKHPIINHWNTESSIDVEVITQWFTKYPNANIAVDLGKSGLSVIDVDPRNGGDVSFDVLCGKFGKIESDLHQISGGNGFHLFYKTPAIVCKSGSLGKGIDFKSNGYVLLEPSNHKSGGFYGFVDNEPFDTAPSELPNWISSLVGTKETIEDKTIATCLLTNEQVTDLRAALQFWDADDYNEWIESGHALKTCGVIGFELWDEFSQRSDKYDASQQAKRWSGFNPTQIRYETIFFEAQKKGFINVPTPPEPILINIESVKPYQKDPSILELPKLTGVLGIIEDYYNDTAPISNPLFAKQCAISIVSTLLGRRFKTKYRHLTSLYLACIGHSGAGKDHVKTTINSILKEIGKTNLLGGNGYTSSGAVISTLARQPVHLTTIDELGHYLKECQGNNASHRRGAVSMLMQCITSLDSHVTSESYSRMGELIMKKEGDLSATSHQTIEQPAISLMGLTTPSTFFDALTVEMIKDGFYGRFLTVHSKQEPKPVSLRGIKAIEFPQSIKDFSDSIDARYVSLGNLSMVVAENGAVSVKQVELDIDDNAIDLLDAFAAEMTALQKELSPLGFESLVNRAAEFACRLSLIFELSNNPQSLSITPASALASISYVRSITIENVTNVKEKIVGNLYQREKGEILDAIRSYGSNGITRSEMGRKAPFSKHKSRDLDEIISSLTTASLIALVNTREGKAGGARNAYIAIDVATIE